MASLLTARPRSGPISAGQHQCANKTGRHNTELAIGPKEPKLRRGALPCTAMAGCLWPSNGAVSKSFASCTMIGQERKATMRPASKCTGQCRLSQRQIA